MYIVVVFLLYKSHSRIKFSLCWRLAKLSVSNNEVEERSIGSEILDMYYFETANL